MGEYSLAQWLPYAIVVLLTAVPAWKLFGRVGLSRWWTLLSVIPLGMIIILWFVALRRWPAKPN